MKQSDIFLKSEGDAWHKRNKKVPRLPDMVLDAIKAAELRPKSVLELGCGNGWRLAAIKKMWPDCHCLGYDPSSLAVEDDKERAFPNVMVADALRGLYYTQTNHYDMVIFGFCLYLVDRVDLQMIVGHADRVLKDRGHIVIHDFFVSDPRWNNYKHKEGIRSYKMNYAQLWLANPIYQDFYSKFDDKGITSVLILRKDLTRWGPEELRK